MQRLPCRIRAKMVWSRRRCRKPSKIAGTPASSSAPIEGPASDAVQALINLGYHPLNAQKAVKAALESEEKELAIPKLISLSLQLGK